ncbi:hypothetical protein C8R44DRAFT_742719 [Mycena epipterygia]|nr:hypothetical protein C8R44DRAFT_742719 [Mycena epipterygia]
MTGLRTTVFLHIILLLLLLLSEISCPELNPGLVIHQRRNNLTNPQLFTINPNNHYKCNICPESIYMVFSRAKKHEDNKDHTRLARNLDHPEDPVLIQPESPSLADGTPPRAATESPGLFHTDWASVHGPALDSDSEDQIYDDFSGELALNRPSFEDESDEEESWEIHGSHQPSDGPIQLYEEESDHSSPHIESLPSSDGPELPESDGLLMDRDERLDRAQELFAPGNALQLTDSNDWWCWRSKQPPLMPKKKEFANPLVRKHLHLYPEDSGCRLEEARQAAKWKEEVDGNVSAPMARAENGKDYYVEEAALANIDDEGTVGPVMPMRWFTRHGIIWAVVHRLWATENRDAYIIDGTPGGCFELPLTAFFLTSEDLDSRYCQQRYSLPPLKFAGVLHDSTRALRPWDQPLINPWRVKAKGLHVHSVPLWTYCDDTSGNVSKKWNKHNSVLFTLAGLPREYSQMFYNVHFMATSNIAPPLEMMEAVTDMLRDARDTGIRVWDCEFKEYVLVIPWILAFQGDSPMSTTSSKKTRAPGDAGEIERLKDFMTAGSRRSKTDTIADLEKQLERAINGAPSAVSEMATGTGSKDKHFQHFIDKLQEAANKLREEQKDQDSERTISKAAEVKAMLHRLRDEMPENLFNPVLSILDFDANSDSPVEILHVVLLGVVKYWWRDAVSRQTSKGKEELRTRLSSIDTAGLNCSRLRGNMYVQYAGSLVGRDFRVILQVAPVVLHGLIPAAHYEGWLALCKLAPLMFQPAIEDLTVYTTHLEDAVFDFLAATAMWNTQWFNKPKFHLFVHLVPHIRRFGPLILYATETFESFNLVIRLRSVHSTKHAPSLDIGASFAHLHAIRHLVSGGFVLNDTNGLPLPFPRQAGPQVTALLDDDEFLKFMSMTGLKEDSRAGFYTPLHGACAWDETLASQIGRVEEILVEDLTSRLLGVLVSQCEIGPNIMPYSLPSCTVDTTSCLLLAFQELLCAINVVHNCAGNGCISSTTRQVIQEREIIADKFESELKHPIRPDDCFLNLAQLRSAVYVQKFRSLGSRPRSNLALTEVIEAAVFNRKRLEREARDVQADKGIDKAKKAKAPPIRVEPVPPQQQLQQSTASNSPGMASTSTPAPVNSRQRTKRPRSDTSANIDSASRHRQIGAPPESAGTADSALPATFQWIAYDPNA